MGQGDWPAAGFRCHLTGPLHSPDLTIVELVFRIGIHCRYRSFKCVEFAWQLGVADKHRPGAGEYAHDVHAHLYCSHAVE